MLEPEVSGGTIQLQHEAMSQLHLVKRVWRARRRRVLLSPMAISSRCFVGDGHLLDKSRCICWRYYSVLWHWTQDV